MTDDLRSRIAAVLVRDAFGMTTQSAALRQADAVIRELGLRRERRYTPPVPRMPRLPTGYRYATEWETK